MNQPAPPEHDLRYWLVNEDWYISRTTREWLERTPPDEAADVLAGIAEDAAPEPRSGWSAFLTAFASSGFSPSNAIAGKGPDARKAGVRAALMLANLGDARGVAPLVRVFETQGSRQNKYQELIEAALTRLLSEAAGALEAEPHAPILRDLAERIWNSGGERRDLSPAFTDLLLAALRRLHGFGGEPDRALLRTIAESGVTKPNRARVRDTARALLGD